jgi:hypothetical protein
MLVSELNEKYWAGTPLPVAQVERIDVRDSHIYTRQYCIFPTCVSTMQGLNGGSQ